MRRPSIKKSVDKHIPIEFSRYIIFELWRKLSAFKKCFILDTETKVNFVMESGGEVEVEFWSRDFAVHGFTFVLQK